MKKIDFYVIPPLSELELMENGDRFFCLAQLYKKDEKYREFFKQKLAEGKWVTLDNGTGDNDAISQDELFEIMLELMPSEVIPLDVLFNKDETLSNVKNFIERLRSVNLEDKIEIFACPQGNTFNEWVDCYIQLSNLKEVKTIGMSKLAIPWVMSGSKNDQNIARDRNNMFDFLEESGLLKKQLHFLGAGEPKEFLHYKDSVFVRSTDSCFTCWSAMNNISFDEEYRRIPTPKDYFQRTMTEEQIALAKENISILSKYLN